MQDEKSHRLVAFQTLGCKVNHHDTEAMEALFRQAGYEIGDFEEAADVYVINTCTVTHLSDRKSRQMIRRAASLNPDGVIAVVGCYAQTAPDQVAAIGDVDLILGTNQQDQIVTAVEKFRADRQKRIYFSTSSHMEIFEPISEERLTDMTRAYLKVQEGCEQYCTYCIIPYARGPLRSRDIRDAVTEAKRFVKLGFQEIVLSGIHLGAFGQDGQSGEGDLVALCQAILAETKIARIRLSSIEPTEVTPALVGLMASEPRMCPHLHIPLQAGDDAILKAMNRPYDTAAYRACLAMVRHALPDVAITTDLMVGFPGESDDQFRNSLIFCNEAAFADMHVFKYSPRSGTPASTYPDQVDAKVKDKRSKMMMDVCEKNKRLYEEAHLGQVLSLLIEEQEPNGDWVGHTENYLRIRLSGQFKKNDIIPVRLLAIERNGIRGEALA